MKYFTPLFIFLPMILVLALSREFFEIMLINGAGQVLLFLFVVQIPAYRTGRMSYVDIGWPLGLALIGGLVLLLGDGAAVKKYAIGGVYLFMGLRMGLTALVWLYRGAFATELPRYKFQRIRWGREKKKNAMLAMQVDIVLQSLANVSFLSLPALLIAFHTAAEIHPLEIAGAGLWLLCFAGETLADKQKADFAKQAMQAGDRKAVCDVGLWRYSRHPNYFFEWMVWNALIIAAIPAYIDLFEREGLVVWIAIGLGLLFVSRIMYTTLVLFTGAIPSEYYSMKKRPGYREYRRKTNMFFPGPTRA